MTKEDRIKIKAEVARHATTLNLDLELWRRLAKYELEVVNSGSRNKTKIIERALSEWLSGKGY